MKNGDSMSEFGPVPYASLKSEEAAIMPTITTDDTLRVKLLDRCGMTCTFCHNEGTPVQSKTGFQALRVSIYSDRNKIPFTQSDITAEDSDSFAGILTDIKEANLGSELHWTGGEPTLSKNIIELTSRAADIGYEVKMTSNGQSGNRQLQELAKAGLRGINFSIFGTTPEELAATQSDVFKNNLKLAQIRLDKMEEAMSGALAAGLNVKANIVITGAHDIERGHRLLEETDENVKVRFQADTSNRSESLESIYQLMTEIDGHPVSRDIVAGCSIDNFDYVLPSGRVVTFKQARQTRLPHACEGCPVDAKGECYEGYYGIRLYRSDSGQYWLSPCIQQMNTSSHSDDFFSPGGLGEAVRKYREEDYNSLVKQFAA